MIDGGGRRCFYSLRPSVRITGGRREIHTSSMSRLSRSRTAGRKSQASDDETDWEPMPWDPNRTVQNPEEVEGTRRVERGKDKTGGVFTVSVPIKVQRQWLSELSRLEDAHTISSALEALRKLSMADKMPLERVTPFVVQFTQSRDHQVHKPYTRRACVSVYQNLCEDRGEELGNHVKRLASCIGEYCGDDDAGVRRTCVLAYQALVERVVSRLGKKRQPAALNESLEPLKEILRTSHNPCAQDGAAMCLAMILDSAEAVAGAEDCAVRMLPPLLKRLRRTKPMAKASVLNALSACVCRSGDRFVRYAVDIATAILAEIMGTSDSCGGWQGKKCAIDIITQIGESTPLPLHLIEDINDALDKNRFDKVPAVRDCVKDSMSVYQKAANMAIAKEKKASTVIHLPGEEGLKDSEEDALAGQKTANIGDQSAPPTDIDNPSTLLRHASASNRGGKKMMVDSYNGPLKKEVQKKSDQSDQVPPPSPTRSGGSYNKDSMRQFSVQHKQLRRDFELFREETKGNLVGLQRQVNGMERTMREMLNAIEQLNRSSALTASSRSGTHKATFTAYNAATGRGEPGTHGYLHTTNRAKMESRPGRTEEVFEDALGAYDEKEFVRFIGKFGAGYLSKLALSTQKQVLSKMVDAMEKKLFIGQYVPWIEEAVRLGIHRRIFAGPGMFQRVVDLLSALKETKLLKRFKL